MPMAQVGRGLPALRHCAGMGGREPHDGVLEHDDLALFPNFSPRAIDVSQSWESAPVGSNFDPRPGRGR